MMKRLHPFAFASRALSPLEKSYAVTELETLAVVWACSHFHAHLYRHNVTVYTDHLAVKAILETPSPSGKHTRWWSKVFAPPASVDNWDNYPSLVPLLRVNIVQDVVHQRQH